MTTKLLFINDYKVVGMERFWSKVEKTDSCWNWKSALQTNGYGRFWFKKRAIYAHRISYELVKGKIPNNRELDHLCRNRRCVNPNHLEIVTLKENRLRGISPMAKQARQTHCKRGHKLIKENLEEYDLKLGRRSCKICANITAKIRYNMKRCLSSQQ